MTGGAFGSLIAQFFHLTAAERKTLLVAGAAAGMSATFAAPFAAIMLAVELLLFEWKPRSFIPVALASVTAAARGSICSAQARCFLFRPMTRSSGPRGSVRLPARWAAERRPFRAAHRSWSMLLKMLFPPQTPSLDVVARNWRFVYWHRRLFLSSRTWRRL